MLRGFNGPGERLFNQAGHQAGVNDDLNGLNLLVQLNAAFTKRLFAVFHRVYNAQWPRKLRAKHIGQGIRRVNHWGNCRVGIFSIFSRGAAGLVDEKSRCEAM